MKHRNRIATIIASMAVMYVPAVPAYAAAPADAKAYFGSELAACAAYYNLSAELLRRKKLPDKAETVEKSAMLAFVLARQINSEQRVNAEYKEWLAVLVKEMKLAGMDALVAKYSLNCKSALEHADERYQFWLSK